MIRRGFILGVFIIAIVGLLDIAWALRCHGRIVSVGDSMFKVRQICGEPDRITEWRAPVVETVYDPVRRIHIEHMVYVIDHVWAYDFGRGRLTYILIFHNDTLKEIRTQK